MIPNTNNVFDALTTKSLSEEAKLLIIKDYLLNNADINAKHVDGESLLTLAAEQGYSKIVEFLLQSGADPNLQGNNGAALHLAATEGYEEIVKLLLLYHADPNIQSANGETPLHWAATRNHLKIMELLISFNIDPNIKNRQGFTALRCTEITNKMGAINLVKLLKKVGTQRLERNSALLYLGWADKDNNLSKLPLEVLMMIAYDVDHLLEPEARFKLVDTFFNSFGTRKIETRSDHTSSKKHTLENPKDLTSSQPSKISRS